MVITPTTGALPLLHSAACRCRQQGSTVKQQKKVKISFTRNWFRKSKFGNPWPKITFDVIQNQTAAIHKFSPIKPSCVSVWSQIPANTRQISMPMKLNTATTKSDFFVFFSIFFLHSFCKFYCTFQCVFSHRIFFLPIFATHCSSKSIVYVPVTNQTSTTCGMTNAHSRGVWHKVN